MLPDQSALGVLLAMLSKGGGGYDTASFLSPSQERKYRNTQGLPDQVGALERAFRDPGPSMSEFGALGGSYRGGGDQPGRTTTGYVPGMGDVSYHRDERGNIYMNRGGRWERVDQRELHPNRHVF